MLTNKLAKMNIIIQRGSVTCFFFFTYMFDKYYAIFVIKYTFKCSYVHENVSSTQLRAIGLYTLRNLQWYAWFALKVIMVTIVSEIFFIINDKTCTNQINKWTIHTYMHVYIMCCRISFLYMWHVHLRCIPAYHRRGFAYRH